MISLSQLAKDYNDSPGQQQALQALQAELEKTNPELFALDSEFVQLWRGSSSSPSQNSSSRSSGSMAVKLQTLVQRGQALTLAEAKKYPSLIQQIQIRLNALKLLRDKADGIYGPKTEAALRRFANAFDLDFDPITPTLAKKLIQEKEVPLPSGDNDWISPEDLAQVFNISVDLAAEHLPYIVRALAEKQMLDRPTLIGVLATIFVETEGFLYFEELGGNSYFTRLYENRSDLGNTQPGDGARFHGRGYIQITGRANYTKYGQILGVDLVNNPDLASQPEIASKFVAQYFEDRNIDQKARAGDWEEVRYRVNGGYNHYDKFLNMVNRLDSVMKR